MTPRTPAWLLTGALALAAGPLSAQSWLDTRAGIEELHEAGEAEGAKALGDEYLDYVRQDFGPTSPDVIDTLLQLADLYIAFGDAAIAVERISEAIGILGPVEASGSTQLMDAYIALGEAYSADDLNQLAIEAFEQARELSRRRLGLHNTEQIDILYSMSRAALDEGDVFAAAGFRQDAQDIHVRARLEALRNDPAMQSRDPGEFLDARLAYANALMAEGQNQDALLSYAQTLEIIETEFGKSSRMRAAALLAQTESIAMYMRGRVRPYDETRSMRSWRFRQAVGNDDQDESRDEDGDGFEDEDQDGQRWGAGEYNDWAASDPPDVDDSLLTSLQKARRTIGLMIDPDPLLRAEFRRELGDWRMLGGFPAKAERAYRDSWKILDTIDGGEELQHDWFGQIDYIRDPGHRLLGVGILTLDPDAPTGEVALEFSIDWTGHAQDIRVVRANPEWMTGFAEEQIAGTLFRPRFVDGDLVTTPGSYTWTFRYDPKVAEMIGLAPPASPQGATPGVASGATPRTAPN